MNVANDNDSLIVFDNRNKRFSFFILFLFVILVSAELHGYSISLWRNYIDGSKHTEILAGSPRPIRSDDWAVEIPLMLAQNHHSPTFPLVNRNIGNGLNMLAYSKVPIDHPISIFRPTTWGFWANEDFGLSWMWQSMFIGLFFVYYLVFMLMTKNDSILSISGSLWIAFSPFFQFWSFHMAEIPIFMGLIFISFAYVCFARTTASILIHSIILGWSLGGYAFNFVYPPYQVSCAYLLAFIIVGYTIHRWNMAVVREKLFLRIAGIFVALIIFGWAVFLFVDSSKEAISAMLNTSYPGKRFFTGGGYDIWNVMRMDYLMPLFYIALSGADWGHFGNICETGSFLIFFPLFFLIFIVSLVAKKKVGNALIVALFGYIALMMTYAFVGFPDVLSRYSLFYMMQTHRSMIGVGIADTMILVCFLSVLKMTDVKLRGVLCLLWTILLIIIGAQLERQYSQITLPYIIGASASMGLVSYYLLDNNHRWKAISVITGVVILATSWFNPIVHGGTSFFYENGLSKKIMEIDELHEHRTNWAVYDSWVIGNLFRILGVKAVCGTYSYPHPALWQQFDPESRSVTLYNRYAHIQFEPTNEKAVSFRTLSPDLLVVGINPDSNHLRRLNVTHVMVSEANNAFFKDNAKFNLLFSYHGRYIYEITGG